MLLLSPPRCDYLLRGRAGKQTTFTSRRLSLPLWHARPASALVALRSLQENISPQPAICEIHQEQPSCSTNSMSSPRDFRFDSPRSPMYSPTLNSIPEVFEYEPLDITSEASTPNETYESPEAFLPEPATTAVPTVFIGPIKAGIILSPRKAMTARASTRVTSVLRKVLETDRVRRRRVLRVYLKAIVFLKMLLKAHERYTSMMAASGVYMQR